MQNNQKYEPKIKYYNYNEYCEAQKKEKEMCKANTGGRKTEQGQKHEEILSK